MRSPAEARDRIALMAPLSAAVLTSVVLEEVLRLQRSAERLLVRGTAEVWDGLLIGGVNVWQTASRVCDASGLQPRPVPNDGAEDQGVDDLICRVRWTATGCGLAAEIAWPAGRTRLVGEGLDTLLSRLPRRSRSGVEHAGKDWRRTVTAVRRVAVGLALLERTIDDGTCLALATDAVADVELCAEEPHLLPVE